MTDVQLAADDRQLRFVDGFGKAFNAVVAGVDLHQQGGIVIHRLAIVFGMGAVGGAHFVQLTTRLAHHVGDAERPADLHQLAAGFGSLVDDEMDQQVFIMDLSFNPEITDELMVIYFDLNQEIFCITHES